MRRDVADNVSDSCEMLSPDAAFEIASGVECVVGMAVIGAWRWADEWG